MKDIQGRAFDFACSVVRLHRTTTATKTAEPMLRELLHFGLSIGSILEEAESIHDKADFIGRCRVSLREARKTLYWLRLLDATRTIKSPRLAPLTKEAREIVASLSAIIRNANLPK
jgi:four helix bundle protein